MSFIERQLKEQNQRNQDKITLSIRISVKQDLILQELADSLEITRQEIITRLIQDYIVNEWEEVYSKDADNPTDENVAEDTQKVRYYLLNTNSVNDIDDHNFMLKNQYAAAFEDGYKEKICRFKKGDFVFLYASGQGIVGYGTATGEVEKTHHYGIEDKTYFQKLDNFVDLTHSPINARNIKSILGRSFPFALTLSKIFDGHKIIEFIEQHQLANQQK